MHLSKLSVLLAIASVSTAAVLPRDFVAEREAVKEARGVTQDIPVASQSGAPGFSTSGSVTTPSTPLKERDASPDVWIGSQSGAPGFSKPGSVTTQSTAGED